jgi:hypothetical protein
MARAGRLTRAWATSPAGMGTALTSVGGGETGAAGSGAAEAGGGAAPPHAHVQRIATAGDVRHGKRRADRRDISGSAYASRNHKLVAARKLLYASAAACLTR